MILLLMKKSWIILLVLIVNLFFVVLVSAEVRINEVMYNPTCSGDDCEYVEIYSTENINITLIEAYGASSNRSINISIINGYNTITKNITEFLKIWASDNLFEFSNMGLAEDDKVWVYSNSAKLDYLYYNHSIGANGNEKSLQFCSNSWLENNPTPGQQNNCTIATTPNPAQNNTQNPVQNNSNKKTLISLDISWNDDEIINGEEFKIKAKAYNLKSQSYNFKIWIKKEDEETVISDRYGEDSNGKEVWKSGSYYIYNLFEGSGNKTESVKLRIREDYRDFFGDAEICFKIENANENCEAIEILEKEEKVNKNNTEKIKATAEPDKSADFIAGEVIKLGGSESKEAIANNQKNANNNVIYQSKNEKIKIYAIIGFAVLCLGLVILVLFNKLN